MKNDIINIEQFLKTGIIITDKNRIQTIKENNDEIWEDIFTFNYNKYKIEFIFDEEQKVIKTQQIRVWHSPNNSDLNSIYLLKKAKVNLNNINAIYIDDTNETIILLENGINIHYNLEKLSLITSESELTRKLITKTMTKIK